MIGHQAIAQEPQRFAFLGLQQHALEGIEIGRLMEQSCPCIATVQDVVDQATDNRSGTSRHDRMLVAYTPAVNKRLPSPFCLLYARSLTAWKAASCRKSIARTMKIKQIAGHAPTTRSAIDSLVELTSSAGDSACKATRNEKFATTVEMIQPAHHKPSNGETLARFQT